MKLDIYRTSFYPNSVVPILCLEAVISCTYQIEYPNLITGELLCSGKIVSILQISLDRGNEQLIRDITEDENSQGYRENRINFFRLMLLAELDHRKIDFIENERNKHKQKSVELMIRLKVEAITIPTIENASTYKYKLKVEELYGSTLIVQNDWLQEFSPALGIGEFFLVELRKPKPKSNNKVWSGLYETLIDNLNQMGNEIRKGDWQRTMEISRRFFENIKIGDQKAGNEKYKNELKNRMQELQYDNNGIDNLLDGIWKFFEYSSKFVHEKDKDGNSKPIPIAKKEDAYFVYSLCINLTNLVYEKLRSS